MSVAILLGSAAGGCGMAGPSPDGGRAGVTPRVDHDPTHLVLRLGERRLYLVDGNPDSPAEWFPIAVGREGHETPTGRFRVEEMVEHPEFLQIDRTSRQLDPTGQPRVLGRIPPGPANPLGERWIGFIRGDGWTIGIHGTPQPELLGRAVSRGCVRMRNADVIRVYDRIRIGTPVIVER